MDGFERALRQSGAAYSIRFGFEENDDPNCLIFITKHLSSYNLMKELMASQSSEEQDGVATFHYAPVNQARLFNLDSPIETLKAQLLDEFRGRSLSIPLMFERHSVGTRFILKNYQEVVRRLQLEVGFRRCRQPGSG